MVGGQNRYQHKKHALRHKKITEYIYHQDNYFDVFNKYDSFKIHCGCGLCRCKTNNKHRRVFWQKPHMWKASDQKKIESMNAEMAAYERQEDSSDTS